MSKRLNRAVVCGQMVDAPEGDYFVVCSFNPDHVLLRSRMPYHIVKCLRQNVGHTKVPCPYDFTEYIEREELHEHILRCEFKRNTCDANFETAKLIASGKCGNIQQAPFFHDLPAPDEDWGGFDAMEAERARIREEEDKVRREARPEKVIDGSDSEEEGVGRGSRVRVCQFRRPPKGMGRGEVIKRLCEQYQEMKARGMCRPSNFISLVAKPKEAEAEGAAGQFAD